MIQGDHYLEIHIDFDKLRKEEYPISLMCMCKQKHSFVIHKDDVSLIKGSVYTCTICGAKVAFFSNDFKVIVN